MPGRRHVLKAALGLWGLRLLPPALRPSASAAAGRGVHLVGGWILVDRDLARLRG
jgi:hypothetical protein